MMPKTTHSAALEPPPPPRYCDACEYAWDSCRCGEPTCEGCGDYASIRVRYEDDVYDFCNTCEHEGEVLP